MEYVTEERVREIIREELGRCVVNISSPTITLGSGIDIDEVLKKISARLNVDLSSGKSHSKEVIGALYALADRN